MLCGGTVKVGVHALVQFCRNIIDVSLLQIPSMCVAYTKQQRNDALVYKVIVMKEQWVVEADSSSYGSDVTDALLQSYRSRKGLVVV